MSSERILSLLGLARKAGKLCVGYADSKEACQRFKAKFVAVASDVSEKTEKEIKYFSGGKIPVVRVSYTLSEISAAIGTKAGVVAVCDEGFAGLLAEAAGIEPAEQ